MTDASLFALFGGMALLWYGIRLAGEGLQRAAGGRPRQILGARSNSAWESQRNAR